MICTNESCKKKFNAPLELFNGALTCPHCKKELTTIQDFKLTEKNEELYNLSELYFFRYLSPTSYNAGKSKKVLMKPIELLENAIKTCYYAAKEGNPKAVVKMGFYNEYYMEKTRSESDRIRMAFDYYASVCYCADTNVKSEKPSFSMTEDEFFTLKKQAAVSLINLYVKHPRALKGLKQYDQNVNEQRIYSIYGNLQASNHQENSGGIGRVKSLYQVLSASFSRERAPLFGMFLLSGLELKNLFAQKTDKKHKLQNVYKLISRGLQLRYLPCDNNGNISKQDTYFTRFSSESKAKAIIDELSDSQQLFLYFFNSHGKHAYLSGSQIDKISKELASEDYEQLCRLIELGNSEYLFFDDDVMQFKKSGIKGAVTRLIDFVCGEE